MQVNMLEAKNQLSRLVAAAERGEEIILARNGVAVARIVKFESPRVKPPGAWKNEVEYSTAWCSPETDALVASLFDGESE